MSRPDGGPAWRPISEEPDRPFQCDPVVLLCDGYGNRWTDVWPGEAWQHNGPAGMPPTHWMPLPEPPQ